MKSAFWTPLNEWSGQDAFLIGGGPSLTGFDFTLLKGRNVIGCNDAYHLGSDIVRICLFADAAWYHRNARNLDIFQGDPTEPRARLVTNAPSLVGFNTPGLLKMRRIRDGIHTGNTLGFNFSTGAMAINLAFSLGALRIFLLGYDLLNVGVQSHWHQHNRTTTKQSAFDRFARGFNNVANGLVNKGLDVVNVTDGSSRLRPFRRISFQEFLQYLNPPQEVAA